MMGDAKVKRRNLRRYNRGGRNFGMKFAGFFAIIIIAVICGYLTARYLIAPFLGYNTEVLKPDFTGEFEAMLNREKDDSEDESNKSFTLQYGVFSSQDSADKLVSELRNEGKEAYVKEVDGNYKVFGETYASKEKAMKALKELKTQAAADVFVTVIP